MEWDDYGMEDDENQYDDALGGGGFGYDDFEDEEEILPTISSKSKKKKKAEEDMFVIQRVQWRSYQPKSLRKMAAANRRMIMGTRDGHVIRVELDHTEDLEDIGDLGKKADVRVEDVFVDPTGAHVIITVSSGDNYYLNESWKKPKLLTKLRDVQVTAVGWDAANQDRQVSGSVLVGTSKGQLFECVLDAGEKGGTRLWRVLHNTESHAAVAAVAVERVQGQLTLLAASSTQLWVWGGGRSLSEVFEEGTGGLLQELPGSSGSHTELHLLRRSREEAPTHWAWMAEAGVFQGSFRWRDGQSGSKALSKGSLLKYPDPNRPPPVSMALTDLHLLFVYLDKFQSVRRLDQAVVMEQILPGRIGKVRGLCVDVTTSPRSIWVFSEAALFEVVILNEDRDMSALLLRMGHYDQARHYAKDAVQMEAINSQQADALFAEGQYEAAAAYYGKTGRQFEEICLQFIDRDAPTALRAFLVNKLQTLGLRESTQKTMLCTWLVEIYLNRLDTLQERVAAEEEGAHEEMQAVSAEFRQMLDENKAFLDYNTSIGLITSHGRYKEMIFYANLMEDYERVINAFINAGDFKNALIILQKQTSEELFYRFSPILMANSPYHTVNAWTRCASFLKPRRLIPALMRYDAAQDADNENQAIRYLEFCTKKFKNQDEAIHNYLMSLYCEEGDDDRVCEFIVEGGDGGEVWFDLKYALRLVSQHKLVRAQVLIYGLMSLFEEAVELALTFDLELAQTYANKPDDDQLQKRLWLRIAKHVVTSGGDIKRAMELLKECMGVIKIEDILPFFPEFVRIEAFKDEICESLEEYNQEIEQLREAMDMSTQSADNIRSDIAQLSQQYGFVEGQQKCQACDGLVLTRLFYLFPCQHCYHADCLIKQMMDHDFDDVQRHRFNTLNSQIRQTDLQKPAGAQAEEARRLKLQKLRGQMDELVAAECPLCGLGSIKQIVKPFVDLQSQEAKTWAF